MLFPKTHARPVMFPKSLGTIHTLLGSVITPFRALAATVAGDARYIRESWCPIRPLKLRLVLDMQTSPAPSTPRWPPTHAPQVELVTIPPDSISILIIPLSKASMYVARLAGVMIRRTPLCIFLPLSISAAIIKSPILPFVQEPMNA